MKKIVAFLLKTVSVIVVSAVAAIIFLSIAIQIPGIQKYATDKATQYLSERTGAEFSIEGISLGFLNRVKLEGVTILDHTSDTMINVNELKVAFKGMKFHNGNLRLGTVEISGASILMEKEPDGTLNIAKVFSKLKNPNRKIDLTLDADRFVIKNSDITIKEILPKGKKIDAENLNLDIHSIKIGKKEYQADIREISFYERQNDITLNGLTIKDFFLDSVSAGFANASITLDKSRLMLAKTEIAYDSLSAIKHGTLETEIAEGTSVSLWTVYKILGKRVDTAPLTAWISGKLIGKVDDFSGDIVIVANGNSIDADFSVSGITDIKNSKFRISAARVETDYKKISQLLAGVGIKKKLPGILERVGTISINGEFDGNPASFNTQARISTGCGNIDLAGIIQLSDSTLNLHGHLDIPGFNLGIATGKEKLGKIALSGDLDASKRGLGGMKAEGNIVLNSAEYGGYSFHDIVIDGKLENRKFTGTIESKSDPNLLFSADGIYSFAKDSLPFYNFNMNLGVADLAAIGLNKRDSVSKLKGVIAAKFSGNDIDNINGHITIDSYDYINQVDTINMGTIYIDATNNKDEKLIEFKSKIADAELRGNNSYRNLIPYFKELAKSYLPSYDAVDEIVASYEKEKKDKKQASSEHIYDDGFYRFKLTAKETNRIFTFLAPGLEMAKGSGIDFYFNPAANKFNLKVHSEAIVKGKTLVEKLKIESYNNRDSLFLKCKADLVNMGKFTFSDAAVESYLHDNRIWVRTSFGDTTNMADIKVDARISKDKNIIVNLLPSKLKIDTSAWDISSRGIIIGTSAIVVDTLNFKNKHQNILIDGRIGNSRSDTIVVKLNKLDLTPATFFIKDAGFRFSAIADGHAELISGLGEKILKGKIGIADINFTGEKLGSCILESSYDNEKNRLILSILCDDGTKPVEGFYSLNDRILDLQTHFPTLRLKLLSPILKSFMTNIEGTANSDVHFQLIRGKIPVLNGKAEIKEFAGTIDYTKVRYKVVGNLDIKDNHISMSNGIIHDIDGNTATMSGFFESADFRKFRLAMDIETERILGLNTTKNDNQDFFGKIYGKGYFNINGNERLISLNADMSTSSGSTFNLPFSSIASIDRNKFITFKDSTDQPKTTERERFRRRFFHKLTRAKYSSELDISLKVKATPELKCNIEYTNSTVSNLISGSGDGNIYLHINPKKEIFTLEGGVNIDQGTYRLIFYIADKTFQLKKGSRIWWTGDPSNPLVDFTGIYQVHTSLQPLLGNSVQSAGNVAIDCGIHLSESLFSPKITFDITAPNATPETQSVLAGALNTQEALSTQFFSLFLTNSFSQQSGNTMGNIGTSLVSTTGFEFLSSQISSLLSTDKFSWKPTYKPRTSQNSDEIGMKTQLNLMQNKITLNFEGLYYVDPAKSNRKSQFSGGGDISINLNNSGNLKLKAFTRVVDRFDETQGLQESGVGIYFTQEFDNWKDLKRRIAAYWEKKREKKEERRMFRESLERQRDSIQKDTTITVKSVQSDTIAKEKTVEKHPARQEEKMVIFATEIDKKE